MKCAVVLTTAPDVVTALEGLCKRLETELGGARPDLLVAFYTPHHSAEVPSLRERLLARLDPRVLLGGPAAGVIGEDVEVETQAGLVLWAASLPGAELVPFHLEASGAEGEEPQIHGWPEAVPEGAGFLVIGDPYTTPPAALLEGFATRWPGAPVIGGMASGTQGPGDVAFLTTDGVLDAGCVGLAVGGGVRLDAVVSQGCRPVGRHFVITKAQQNVMLALGGKPPLEQFKSLLEEVDAGDRQLLQRALHVGRVVDERKSRFERGDFLVRNVMGYDPDSGAIAISDLVRPGQTIQFMVRDAAAASQELDELLAAEQQRGPALGAMLFSCNGRGKGFFGEPHHDVTSVHKKLGDCPTAGFFCAGEIGPVGGQPFLHGFTASIALFREAGARAGGASGGDAAEEKA